jgi:hypothetical protein
MIPRGPHLRPICSSSSNPWEAPCIVTCACKTNKHFVWLRTVASTVEISTIHGSRERLGRVNSGETIARQE